TTPVLETLAERYPGQRIDLVADRRSSALFAAAPWLGTVHHRDKRAGLRSQWQWLRALRNERYALAVDLRTPLIGRLVKAERRLLKQRREQPGMHAVAEHFAVLAPLVGDVAPPTCRLHLAPDAIAAAAHLTASLPRGRWLVLAPGANWPGKRWSPQGYAALATAVAPRFDALLVLGGADDAAAAAQLAQAPLPYLDLTGRTDLPLAAALLARAAAFVGNDSGLGHMAAALGVPTLTVFGPGRPARYRPWGPRARIVLAPAADLARLDAATVAAALIALVEESA
ncbi:MAG: glycosyltransferase family 9 protein, partial [Gammaproteobacteria bacterium]